MQKGVKKTDELQAVGLVGSSLLDIGWRLLAVVLLFLLGGRWLDEKYGTDPLFVLVGLVLIVASFVLIVRAVLKNIPKSQGGMKNE